MAILTMTITDCEQVHTLSLAHVRRQGVAVLVYLVRVLWLMTT